MLGPRTFLWIVLLCCVCLAFAEKVDKHGVNIAGADFPTYPNILMFSSAGFKAVIIV